MQTATRMVRMTSLTVACQKIVLKTCRVREKKLVSVTVNKEINSNLLDITCWCKGEGDLPMSSRDERLVFDTLGKS